MIAFCSYSEYNNYCRAKRGGSGALYSQAAIAGPNPHSRLDVFKVCLKGLVLTPRSCATGTHEPCQIRKEAAVSGHSCVPRGSLSRAMNLGNAEGCPINNGCTVYIMKRDYMKVA